MRDLFKDAPLIDRDRKVKRIKKPSSQWESNSGPLEPKSLELPPQPTKMEDKCFKDTKCKGFDLRASAASLVFAIHAAVPNNCSDRQRQRTSAIRLHQM